MALRNHPRRTAARPPVTAPADAAAFREGDPVVYPAHGVGRIVRIGTEDIAGIQLELIQVAFEDNRMSLRIPLAKAQAAGLRPLSSPEVLAQAIGIIRGRPRASRMMWSKKSQEYDAKIKSGDPLTIAEVARDTRRPGAPEQSVSERQVHEAAIGRLAGEMAAVEGITRADAMARITDAIAGD